MNKYKILRPITEIRLQNHKSTFMIFSLSLLVLFIAVFLPVYGQDINNIEYAVGKVQKIVSETQNNALQESLGGNQTTQVVKVKIISGDYKGKVVETTNQLGSNPAYDIKIKPGDRVILDIEKGSKKQGDINVYIADVERMPAILIIVGLFLMMVLLVGGMKGIRTITSLVVTAFLIFFVLIPAILNNYPVIPVTIAVALISTLVTMFTVGGLNIKSVSATIGTIGGVTASGLLSLLVIKLAPLTGITDQESLILWTTRPDLNLTGILASAMIIGSLGAIMDVGISIASSIAEVKQTNASLSPIELMKSGLNVGKDIIGAMSNTLILAYIGSSFPLILLATGVPLVKFVNLNSIASEITAAIVGSIGIVLCVPITAIVSGYLIGKNFEIKFFEIKNNSK